MNSFPISEPALSACASHFPKIDLPGQTQRRHDYLAGVRHRHRALFGTSGEWIPPTEPPEIREWLWDVFAWLDGGEADREFASRLILAAPEIGLGHGNAGNGAYCIFANTHAMHLLVAHGTALSGAARARLEGWARRTITDNPGGARADFQFHGYNDNMPSKATLGLILGGEYFGSRRAVEHGLWNLHQLRLLLARRGVISEHCSPTYTPITLVNLTEIAQYADNAEARELAAACCEHLWAEVFAHYHAPTRSVAGPYSRAYSTDSAGHLSSLHFLLWLVFGDDFVANPVRELFSDETRLIIHHRGDRFFVEAGFAFLTACEHRPPRRIMEWLSKRVFPFDFSAAAERGEGMPWGEFRAGRICIHLHQREGFAVGTSNGDWLQQAERWHVVYRREAAARTPEPQFGDRRHVTLRFVVNDELPGVAAPSPRGDASGEADYIPEKATYHTLQHEVISLVAARPLESLENLPIRRMGLAVILPEHLNRVEEILFEDGHVWVTDGPFQMALRPIGVRRWGAETAEFRVLHSGHYRLLFFPNYEGPERTFSRDELRATVTGFVSICATAHEKTSAGDFRNAVLESSLSDTIWINQRTIRWQGFGHTLEMSYGLLSDALRFAAIDGTEPNCPPWAAKGLEHGALPLARTAAQPNPCPFPYGSQSYGWQTFPSANMAQ